MTDTEPRAFNAKKNLDPPPRNGTTWLPVEHLMAAEAFARNGFAYMPPDHPEVVALAHFWGRTPGAVEATIVTYSQCLSDAGHAERVKNPAKRFEADLVRALYWRSQPRAMMSSRLGGTVKFT